MTVRFKSRSEYQKSYGSRSRSVSPQRCSPLAGLRSDQMGISREPAFQHRRRPGPAGPAGPAQSCSFLFCPPDPHQSSPDPCLHADRTAPPAASRSRSAPKKEPPPVDLDPPGPGPAPGSCPEPAPPAEPGPPAGSRLAVEQRPDGKSLKPRPSNPDSQSQRSSPAAAADGQQALTNEVQHVLRRRAGLRPGGQRSGSHRTEYHRQFNWKKPATAASPLLTAQQVLYSRSRSTPPFKKNLVSMETEYQRNFQGVAPPTGPHLRKHLEHQRVPLFHTHRSIKKRKEEKILRQKHVTPSPQRDKDTPPPQVHRRYRMLTEYESSFRSPLYRILEEGEETDATTAPQAKELRQQALLYRRRAWGTNFCRDHLNQLQSEHNALWEPTESSESTTDLHTPNPTCQLSQDPDSHAPSCVEALDLASRSSICSKRTSVLTLRDRNSVTPPEDRIQALEEEEEEEEEEGNTAEEEGRLPTPRLKLRPVQRTHHDVTTPATGGAIIVGKLKSSGETSPLTLQKCLTDAAAQPPVTRKEAWQDNNSAHHSPGPAPDRHPSVSPPSKVIRMKKAPSPPVAPPPPLATPPLMAPPPLHCIQGTLRHPDFQHNGELGLRFRELQCSGGGCGSDEDDRLSVMSWHSAASCSVASAVLERAQKRRDNFWGKR